MIPLEDEVEGLATAGGLERVQPRARVHDAVVLEPPHQVVPLHLLGGRRLSYGQAAIAEPPPVRRVTVEDGPVDAQDLLGQQFLVQRSDGVTSVDASVPAQDPLQCRGDRLGPVVRAQLAPVDRAEA